METLEDEEDSPRSNLPVLYLTQIASGKAYPATPCQ